MSTPRIVTQDDIKHPSQVYGFPYFAPSPLAEVLAPTIDDYVSQVLPILLPPYIDPAALTAVQQYGVLLTGSTMSGPLFLSPLFPTAPAMAASMAYVDAMVATAITDVPTAPPGQVWARTLGGWVPALTVQDLNTAIANYLPLTGGVLSGALDVSVMGDFGPTGNAAIRINSNSEAVLAFNRNGIDAVKIGLNASNQFVVGGWSWPPGTLTLDISGNLTVPGRVTGGNGVAFNAGGDFAGYVNAGNRILQWNGAWYDGLVNNERVWGDGSNWVMTLDSGGDLYVGGNLTAANLEAGGEVRSNGAGRIIAQNAGNNPSVTVWDSNQGAAAGMFLGAGPALCFGNDDGSGNYAGDLFGYFDYAGNLVVSNSITGQVGVYCEAGSGFGLWIDASANRWIGFLSGWALALDWSGQDLEYFNGNGFTGFQSAWNGDFYVHGDVYAGNVSDVRTKRDIRPYARGLAELRQLNPVSWEYNGQGGTTDDGKTHYGLTAQDIAPIVPECVRPTWVKPHPDHPSVRLPGQLSVDDKPLLYILINAVKEILTRIETLEARA